MNYMEIFILLLLQMSDDSGMRVEGINVGFI